MNIRVILGKNGDEDKVILSDRSRWTWSVWLKQTELAVKTVRSVLTKRKTAPGLFQAYAWLVRCGIKTQRDFDDLEKHLPKLHRSMNVANGRRCLKCNSRIWGKEALLTGLGSSCRHGGNRARRLVRDLRSRFQIAL